MNSSATEKLEATRERLLHMAGGFTAIALGLPVALLLFFDTVRIRVWRNSAVPPYLIGMALIGYGLYRMRRAGSLPAGVRRHWRRAVWASLLLVYLAPMVGWWQRVPGHPWFFVNMLVFFLGTLWLLTLLSQLVEDLAASWDMKSFQYEARLAGWSVCVVSLVPFLGLFAAAMHDAVISGTPLPMSMIGMVQRWPRMLAGTFLVPFSLVLATVWKARCRCMQRLAGRTEVPE